MAAQKILPFLTNRNPRNLEYLRVVRKALGYQYEAERAGRSFYYKVELLKSKNHTSALVHHFQSGVVVKVSTKEPAIASRLYSCVDVSAAENVGRILAHRCFQCGIDAVYADVNEANASEKSKAFYSALEESGLRLSEADHIEPEYSVDKKYHWIFYEPAYGNDFDPSVTNAVAVFLVKRFV